MPSMSIPKCDSELSLASLYLQIRSAHCCHKCKSAFADYFLCLWFVFHWFGCSLFANSVSVAGPISQAILSSFLFGISSLLVPHWLWIAWSRILDLCQIIQLRKQMRLETTNKSGWHLCEPFQFKSHCGLLLPPIHYRPKSLDISTNKNVTAA